MTTMENMNNQNTADKLLDIANESNFINPEHYSVYNVKMRDRIL